ncbi:MAG: hypothetical protein WA369_19690 [Candidatus Acidiferrales bacterium]
MIRRQQPAGQASKRERRIGALDGPALGGHVALFVLILVGLVAGQTWLDWREARKDWVIPDWAKGMALAAVVAVSLTAVTSFASVWLQDSAGQWSAGFGSRFFWMELIFLFVVLGMIVLATRKKQLRWLLVVASIVTAAAFWFGLNLFS